MKKFVLKLNIALILALTGIPVCAKNQSNLDASAHHSHFDEKKSLRTIIQTTTTLADIARERVDRFFSTSDTYPYAYHINQISLHLNRMEKELITPLKQLVHEAPHASEQYKIIIAKIDYIIDILHKNLHILYSTLNENRNKPTLVVATALKRMQSHIQPAIATLSTEIHQLSRLITQYDPQLAPKVIELQTNFQRALNSKTGSLELLNGLRHRLNCK